MPVEAHIKEHPAWFHNLRANPDVVFGGRPFRAEVVSDEAERTRLWALADRVFPSYAIYRERAARAFGQRPGRRSAAGRTTIAVPGSHGAFSRSAGRASRGVQVGGIST